MTSLPAVTYRIARKHHFFTFFSRMELCNPPFMVMVMINIPLTKSAVL